MTEIERLKEAVDDHWDAVRAKREAWGV